VLNLILEVSKLLDDLFALGLLLRVFDPGVCTVQVIDDTRLKLSIRKMRDGQVWSKGSHENGWPSHADRVPGEGLGVRGDGLRCGDRRLVVRLTEFEDGQRTRLGIVLHGSCSQGGRV
jgi:hypothetical protein